MRYRSLVVVLLSAVALAATGEWRTVDVARVDTDQAKGVEIVSQKMSPDGRQLAIEVRPTKKQFSFDLDVSGRDFQHVVVTVRGVRRWQIVRYLTDPDRAKASIDLLHLPGVKIAKVGEDSTIDFTTLRATKVLAPTGRLMLKQDSDQSQGSSEPAP